MLNIDKRNRVFIISIMLMTIIVFLSIGSVEGASFIGKKHKTCRLGDYVKIGNNTYEIEKGQTFNIKIPKIGDLCFISGHDGKGGGALGYKVVDMSNGQTYFYADGVDKGDKCYTEAVAFKDLNKDGVPEFIIINLCNPYWQMADSKEEFHNHVFVSKVSSKTISWRLAPGLEAGFSTYGKYLKYLKNNITEIAP